MTLTLSLAENLSLAQFHFLDFSSLIVLVSKVTIIVKYVFYIQYIHSIIQKVFILPLSFFKIKAMISKVSIFRKTFYLGACLIFTASCLNAAAFFFFKVKAKMLSNTQE